MITKEQIEAAIDNYPKGHVLTGDIKDIYAHYYLNTYGEEVLFALRLTQKLMGEPSDGMIRCTEPNECALYKSCIYKDMRDQLLKETEEALNG